MPNCIASCPAVLGIAALATGLVGSSVRVLHGFSYLENIDHKWTTAIILQITCWVVAGLLILSLFAGACMAFPKPVYFGIGLAFWFICALFQGLVLIVFRSAFCEGAPKLQSYDFVDEAARYCKWGAGSVTAVIACCLYFFTGVLCFWAASGGRKKHTTEQDLKSVRPPDEEAPRPQGTMSLAEMGAN